MFIETIEKNDLILNYRSWQLIVLANLGVALFFPIALIKHYGKGSLEKKLFNLGLSVSEGGWVVCLSKGRLAGPGARAVPEWSRPDCKHTAEG